MTEREPPPVFRSLEKSAPRYVPEPQLCEAVNLALALHAPLLITGEPGTGKSQVAYWLAAYFGLNDASLMSLSVRSTSVAEDLGIRFDAVGYLYAANDRLRATPPQRKEFMQLGPLALAYQREEPSIVLIDEIDKAPRDFPNDLLNVLDQHVIEYPHVSQAECAPLKPRGPAPLVVITSNSERKLPEPFLRRCIFHHIRLTPEYLDQIIAAHKNDWAGLPDAVLAAARARFLELRGRDDLRKRPSSGEFLAWAKALHLQGVTDPGRLSKPRLSELPAIAALIKDSEDLDALRQR